MCLQLQDRSNLPLQPNDNILKGVDLFPSAAKLEQRALSSNTNLAVPVLDNSSRQLLSLSWLRQQLVPYFLEFLRLRPLFFEPGCDVKPKAQYRPLLLRHASFFFEDHEVSLYMRASLVTLVARTIWSKA